MICPECGSSDTRTSRTTRWGDYLQRVRWKKAFRCRRCGARFHASQPSGTDAEYEDSSSKRSQRSAPLMGVRARRRLVRRLVVIAIFLVAFLFFWLFLRFYTTDKGPSQNSGASSIHLTDC